MKKSIFIACVFWLTNSCHAYESMPVDEIGVACISVKSTGSTFLPSNGATKHEYTIENRCNKSFQINMETIAGWTGITHVAAGKTTTWFCTDGFRGNKDCNGGITSFIVK